MNTAIKAADPEKIIPLHITREKDCLFIDGVRECLDNGKIYVVGAGKASGKMAVVLEKILGDLIEEGVVVVPKYMEHLYKTEKIKIIGAGHPVPDEDSVRGGEEIIGITERIGEKDVLIALISGGGSALIEKPIPPITIEDIIRVNKLLLESGADIYEINVVRKHLSMIKGGRLALKAGRAKHVYSLIISDVPGDDPSYIASGPTAPDDSTFQEAYEILRRYELLDKIPENVLKVLLAGIRGDIDETPKSDHQVFHKVSNIIIASNYTVLSALKEYLSNNNYKTYMLTTRLEGESRVVGRVLASIALDQLDRRLLGEEPVALLLGGETTVTLRSKPYGKGGRCQELALSFLAATRGRRGVAVVSFDTDGIDGSSNAAGAYADHRVWSRMVSANDKPWDYLEKHDSYTFFEKYGGLIITGPTGTNVNIVVAVLINPYQDN